MQEVTREWLCKAWSGVLKEQDMFFTGQEEKGRVLLKDNNYSKVWECYFAHGKWHLYCTNFHKIHIVELENQDHANTLFTALNIGTKCQVNDVVIEELPA